MKAIERMRPEQREAIARLMAIALGDTGQARRVADFLLAWHNADENGKWDPVDLWSLDAGITQDIFAALGACRDLRAYPGELGFQAEITRIWELWRKERKGRHT